jgi:hypothetical protein
MRQVVVTILFFICLFQSQLSFGLEKPTPKLLVLIVATDSNPVYVEGQKIWKTYMHLDPEHIESYFIKANPNLSSNYKIEGDTIWCKTNDTLLDLMNKTLLAYECLSDRLHEFDYILRTSTTTFYVFPRLLPFLQTLPKQKCFAGPQHRCGDIHGGTIECGGFFYGGPGYILSPDLVELQLQNKHILFNNCYYYDDALLACFFLHHKIPMIPTVMMQFPNIYWWWVHKDILPDQVFHFRYDRFINPREREATDQIYVLSELAKKFYNVSISLEIDKLHYDCQECIFYGQERPWKIWESNVFHNLIKTEP